VTAQLDVLTVGYVGDRVAGTVVLVRDGDLVAVVDPGMVASRSRILDPLAHLGIAAEEVTDVVFSHHHPDHTLNAALFANARFHDFQAVYHDDLWVDREFTDDVSQLSPSVRLLLTPGHTAQDVSTLVDTGDGVVVCDQHTDVTLAMVITLMSPRVRWRPAPVRRPAPRRDPRRGGAACRSPGCRRSPAARRA